MSYSYLSRKLQCYAEVQINVMYRGPGSSSMTQYASCVCLPAPLDAANRMWHADHKRPRSSLAPVQRSSLYLSLQFDVELPDTCNIISKSVFYIRQD